MLKAGNRANNEPVRSWNYCVIEFVPMEEESWRSIHEVQYANDVPRNCNDRPAVDMSVRMKATLPRIWRLTRCLRRFPNVPRIFTRKRRR
jgi:hypothetical protein